MEGFMMVKCSCEFLSDAVEVRKVGTVKKYLECAEIVGAEAADIQKPKE